MGRLIWGESGDFIALPAQRSLGSILERTENDPGKWILLWRRVPWEARTLYYAFRRHELERVIAADPSSAARPAVDALDLHERGRSPSVDAAAPPSELTLGGDPGPDARAVAVDRNDRAVAIAQSAGDPAAGFRPRPSVPHATGGFPGLGGFRSGRRSESPPAPVGSAPEEAPGGGFGIAPSEGDGGSKQGAGGMLDAVLSAEGPAEIQVGESALLDVRLEAAEGARPLAHAVSAAVSTEEQIRVILSVGDPAVEVIGPRILTLAPPARGRPTLSSFEVRAVTEGPARIAILFRQGTTELGSVSFDLEVTTAAPSTARVRGSDVAEPTPPPEEPTMTLLILEHQAGDEVRYRYLVDSDELALQYAEFQSASFLSRGSPGAAPLDYVRSIYRRIVERALVNRDDLALFSRELRAIGTDLCRQLFADDFARLLWKNRDRIGSIHITSWEPFIPWELVRLKDPDTGETDERFLCEYGLVRSLNGRKLPLQLELRDWSLLAAEYPEGSYDAVGGEIDAIRHMLPGFGIVPSEMEPRYDLILDTLAAPDFDVLHIAAHGHAEHDQIEQSELVIGDRRTATGQVIPVTLDPVTVREEAKLQARHPLVFLNACESGRQGASLTDWGGWPRAFLSAGAGAFVGTSWAVRERPAQEFAEAFYLSLLRGSTLTAAANAGRAAARALGDGSWLAFTVYGRLGAHAKAPAAPLAPQPEPTPPLGG
jgi:hypothetical protein